MHKTPIWLVVVSALPPIAGGCDGQSRASNADFPHTQQAQVVAAPALSLSGYVTDAAGALETRRKSALAQKLAAFEQATGHQMVVVTTPALNGQDIAAYTLASGNRWGVGRRDYDDGVIVLVAPIERKVRIEVGLGLEDVLTNARCGQIIHEVMIPHFKAGDIADGLDAGVDALIQTLSPGAVDHPASARSTETD